jgi:predicted nucleic acid-binding protein
MVIVDTTVWIDYFNGASNAEVDYLHHELGLQAFGLTDLILCEILQGINDDREFSRVLSAFRSFDVFDTGGSKLAVATAQNYRRLRVQGQTIRKTIDCHIATFCIVSHHSLLHRDRDFNPFEKLLGLSVVHP